MPTDRDLVIWKTDSSLFLPTRPVFPQEVFAHIIDQFSPPDYVSEADELTLRACSLVCSAFRDPAQRHLFKCVTLFLPDPYVFHDPTIAPWKHIWYNSRRLCRFVKTLTIKFAIPADVLFPQIMPLPQLQHVVLFGYTRLVFDEDMDWNDLSEEGRRDAYALLRGPSIKCLSLENIIDFPAAAVRTCTGLKTLMLKRTLLSDDDDDDDLLLPLDDATVVPHLWSLDSIASDMQPLIDVFDQISTPPLMLTRLQKLNFLVNGHESCRELQHLLDLTVATLVELSIEIYFFYPQALRLPRPSILRRIKFKPVTLRDFLTISPFLESVPEENILEKVSIDGYDVPSVCKEPVNAERVAEWHQLERTLMRERHETRLKQVVIGTPQTCTESEVDVLMLMLMPIFWVTRSLTVESPFRYRPYTYITFSNKHNIGC